MTDQSQAPEGAGRKGSRSIKGLFEVRAWAVLGGLHRQLIDCQIFSILIEPIKAEIELSDTQLGLWVASRLRCSTRLASPLPVGPTWAREKYCGWCDPDLERHDHVYQYGQVLCGLLIVLIGVGIGEAGCSPPIHSMISITSPN